MAHEDRKDRGHWVHRFVCALGFPYEALRQLFTGIQLAGPTLTPPKVDEGFHAIPPRPSSDPGIQKSRRPPAVSHGPQEKVAVISIIHNRNRVRASRQCALSAGSDVATVDIPAGPVAAYPIATVDERGRQFVDFVLSAQGQQILARFGFLPP